MFEYRATCVHVSDGDTIDLADMDLGFGITMTQTQRFRLAGINTYETSLRGGTTPEEKEIGLKAKAPPIRSRERRPGWGSGALQPWSAPGSGR